MSFDVLLFDIYIYIYKLLFLMTFDVVCGFLVPFHVFWFLMFFDAFRCFSMFGDVF